jgi:Dolichyl-phosphate-mannose-protein mannosyltransferase
MEVGIPRTEPPAIPTSGYIFVIVASIGLLLLLSGDFGESWDVADREQSALKAYNYYFGGLDSAKFQADPDLDIYYGPLLDVVIGIVQRSTADPLQRFHIRIVLQALLSLSCLIPIFLISARVVSKPLALISVALVVATPLFLGHAFINPKDSVFASGFLWALLFILYCFEGGRRPSYWSSIGLGALLGLVTSLRLIAAYLLLLVPLAAIMLPALRAWGTKVSLHRSTLTSSLCNQTTLQFSRLAVLLLSFAIAYTLSMPAILSDFSLHSFIDTLYTIMHHSWHGRVYYFGERVFPELPWHYVYGYMIVKLPLYYHLFMVTILAASVFLPRATLRSVRDYLRNASRESTVILLFITLIIPLAAASFVRSVRYDELRHVIFIIPLVCMLLYFGFVAVMAHMEMFAKVILVVLATLFWGEAVFANWSLHPYQYVYYNPLVNPAGSFELDYWATSFREIAENLNNYARRTVARGEKLQLFVCGGPSQTLTHFLDPDRFEVSPGPKAVADVPPKTSTPQHLTVALNRGNCIALLKGPWLLSVRRGNLVLAVVARR